MASTNQKEELNYRQFWKKLHLLRALQVPTRYGYRFKLQDETPECIGVSYPAATAWIKRRGQKSIPQRKTIDYKVVPTMREAFDTNGVAIDARFLSDSTPLRTFALAFGADPDDAEDGILSVEIEQREANPLQDFAFADRKTAREHLEAIRGLYKITRTNINDDGSREVLQMIMSVMNVVAIGDFFYIWARAFVPSGRPTPFEYEGILCDKRHLQYWIFTQVGDKTDRRDFIFMVNDRRDFDDHNAHAAGALVTMAQRTHTSRLAKVVLDRVAGEASVEEMREFLESNLVQAEKVTSS